MMVETSCGWAPFISVQPEYSLLFRGVESELLPACQTFGIGVIPYGRNWSVSNVLILEQS